MEYEVSVCSHTSNNKSQNLILEKIGKLTVDQPTKLQYDQNTWCLMTAADPSLALAVEEAPQYTVEDLIQDIKDRLRSRGSLGIRGLSRVFKILDNNGNGVIDEGELYWGLKDFGISLTEAEAHDVLKHFDIDGNGHISFNEFLRTLKGELNASRKAWIEKAYRKLDVNGDGTVKLDDIAKLYDVSRHPDVV